MSSGVFEVLSTSGNTYLGGEDFDDRIMNWMADQFHRGYGHRSAQRSPGVAATERSC